LLVTSVAYVLNPKLPPLPIHEKLALLATYGLMFVGHIRDGFRRKSEAHVWQSIGIAAGFIVHCLILGLISLKLGIAVYVLMGAGFAMWGIGHAVRNDERYSILSRPFQQTGFVLPLAAVAWAIGRRVLPLGVHGFSVETMALLLPAAFYLWRGIEEQK